MSDDSPVNASPRSPDAAASSSASSSGSAGDKTFDVALWDQVERVYQRLTKGRHDLKKVKAFSQSSHETTTQQGRRRAHTQILASSRCCKIVSASDLFVFCSLILLCFVVLLFVFVVVVLFSGGSC